MGVITFNGKTSTEYRIYVEKPPKYSMAEESYEALSIPGRNGDLYYSNSKTFKNVPREYDISFYNGRETMELIANRIYEFLHTANGYARLEDTYDPNVFRLAYYVKRLDLENILFYAGRGKLEFSCKPQRFLKTGEVTTTLSSSGSITNPTLNDASPKIRIYGTGTLGVGNYSIVVADHGSIPYIDVDCELMDAYYGATNCNQYITFGSTDEIVLKPGANAISLGIGITQVIITPRWWIL